MHGAVILCVVPESNGNFSPVTPKGVAGVAYVVIRAHCLTLQEVLANKITLVIRWLQSLAEEQAFAALRDTSLQAQQ